MHNSTATLFTSVSSNTDHFHAQNPLSARLPVAQSLHNCRHLHSPHFRSSSVFRPVSPVNQILTQGDTRQTGCDEEEDDLKQSTLYRRLDNRLPVVYVSREASALLTLGPTHSLTTFAAARFDFNLIRNAPAATSSHNR